MRIIQRWRGGSAYFSEASHSASDRPFLLNSYSLPHYQFLKVRKFGRYCQEGASSCLTVVRPNNHCFDIGILLDLHEFYTPITVVAFGLLVHMAVRGFSTKFWG